MRKIERHRLNGWHHGEQYQPRQVEVSDRATFIREATREVQQARNRFVGVRSDWPIGAIPRGAGLGKLPFRPGMTLDVAIDFFDREIAPRGLLALVCETWTREENCANMATHRIDADSVLVELSVGSGTERELHNNPHSLRTFGVGDYSRVYVHDRAFPCIPWEHAWRYRVAEVAALTLNDPEGCLAASFQHGGRLVLW